MVTQYFSLAEAKARVQEPNLTNTEKAQRWQQLNKTLMSELFAHFYMQRVNSILTMV